MNRVKEIDVWVCPDELIGETQEPWVTDMPVKGYTKAKLLIEMPERKIEITESDYDDAREVWDMDKTVAQNLTAMKKKLFKDQP
jgi:hypothetical protein